MGKSRVAYRNKYNGFSQKRAQRYYENTLTELAIGRFTWSGLPPSIDIRFMEREILYSGSVLVYYDQRVDAILAARGVTLGPPNINDNFTRFRTLNIPGFPGVELSYKECVPVYGNIQRTGIMPGLQYHAHRLGVLETTSMITAQQMRIPKVIAATQDSLLTMQNFQRQIDDGNHAIYTTDSFNMDNIAVLDSGVNPDYLEALRMERNQVWADAMTFLGISNSNSSKKERLVSDEARGAQGALISNRRVGMLPRQQAAERMNLLWNLNVTVEWSYHEIDTEDLDGNGIPDMNESSVE